MTNDTNERLILVTAGNGKTGRRLVERLEGRGVPVRVGSRRGTPPFDWYDESTWAPALDGAAAAYLAFVPDTGIPGASAIVGAFAREAVGRGVRRLVFLSGRGEEEAQASERAVQASGADWTILRAAWFAQDFSEHFLLGPVLDGVVALPAADVAEPFVDVDDIADVAVAALTEEGHVGRLYEMTGPRLLTFTEATRLIAEAADRDVRYVSVTPEPRPHRRRHRRRRGVHGRRAGGVSPAGDVAWSPAGKPGAWVGPPAPRVAGGPARERGGAPEMTDRLLRPRAATGPATPLP